MYYNTRPKSAPKGVTVMCFHLDMTLQKIMQSLLYTNSSKFLVIDIILRCKKKIDFMLWPIWLWVLVHQKLKDSQWIPNIFPTFPMCSIQYEQVSLNLNL